MQLIGAPYYLRYMDNKYLILQKLSDLVKDAPQPTQYQCMPRQLILLLPEMDWTAIYSHLVILEAEGLVQISQADNVQYAITQKGIEKAGSLALHVKKTNTNIPSPKI